MDNNIFGIIEADQRKAPSDAESLASLAEQLSSRLGAVLLTLYDNRSGVRFAALFDRDGVREFGAEDEHWVPLTENGTADISGERMKLHELEEDREYDCVLSAIDLGLRALGVDAVISAATLKDVFCYERLGGR